MKTVEEILREKWEQNGNNSYFDDMYVGERIAIEEAMKEYAIEVAKQTLINVSENFREEFIKKDNIHLAITNESNIPEL